MRPHDAVFFKSITGIAIIVLGSIMAFMVILVVPIFAGMFAGYVSLELTSQQFLTIVFEIILGLICYETIKFLNNFRKNRIDPHLPT